MSYSYNMPPVNPSDSLRLRIGDTNVTPDPATGKVTALFTDEELTFIYTDAGSDLIAASLSAMQMSVSRAANFVDFKIADASFSMSQRVAGAKTAFDLASSVQGASEGLAPMPSAGGISDLDKAADDDDEDKPFTPFRMEDPNNMLQVRQEGDRRRW